MGYNLNQFTADYLRFSSQFNQEYRDNYNNLMNTLYEMENISDADVGAALDSYYAGTNQAINLAVDAVTNSPEVAGDPAASKLWDDIAQHTKNAFQKIYEEICPICQGPLSQEKIDRISDNCKDLSSFGLWPKLGPTNAIEIIASNTLPEWNYGDDPSQRAWYDTWWVFIKQENSSKTFLIIFHLSSPPPSNFSGRSLPIRWY